MVGEAGSTDPKSFVKDLTVEARSLISSSLAPSTRRFYHKVWEQFILYLGISNVKLPVPTANLANYIGHLFVNGLKPSTINSHVSAISYVHKILNMFDPTSLFLIKKMLKGCEKQAQTTSDSRLPITKELLEKLTACLPSVIRNHYHQLLLKAVFLVAFHGFFRLGELACRNKCNTQTVLQRNDVSFTWNSRVLTGVELTLRFFKNNKTNKPVTIFLPCTSLENENNCPVHTLHTYTTVFKHISGPLFQQANGQNLSTQFVTENMHKLITFLGLDPSHYKGHSFRIGAATHAASKGYSEQYIQKIGRWNSNALQRYIRIDNFSLHS